MKFRQDNLEQGIRCVRGWVKMDPLDGVQLPLVSQNNAKDRTS